MKTIKSIKFNQYFKDYKSLLEIECNYLMNPDKFISRLTDFELNDFYYLLIKKINKDFKDNDLINNIHYITIDRLREGNHNKLLEDIIRNDAFYSMDYFYIRKKEDLDFEFDFNDDLMRKSQPSILINYIINVLKKHPVELEDNILSWNSELRMRYFKDFYMEPWPKYEKVIINNNQKEEIFNYLETIYNYYKNQGNSDEKVNEIIENKYEKLILFLIAEENNHFIIHFIKNFIKSRIKNKKIESKIFKNFSSSELSEYSLYSNEIIDEIIKVISVDKYFLENYFYIFISKYFKNYDDLIKRHSELYPLLIECKKNQKKYLFFDFLYKTILKLNKTSDGEKNKIKYYFEIYKMFPEIIEYDSQTSPYEISYLVESIFLNIINNRNDWDEYSHYLIDFQKNFSRDLSSNMFSTNDMIENIIPFIEQVMNILDKFCTKEERVKIILEDFKICQNILLNKLSIGDMKIRVFTDLILNATPWKLYEDKIIEEILSSDHFSNMMTISGYNKRIRKGKRWPELEEALISKGFAYELIQFLDENNLIERIPELEDLLIKKNNPNLAYFYIKTINKRIPEIEEIILSNPKIAEAYKKIKLK